MKHILMILSLLFAGGLASHEIEGKIAQELFELIPTAETYHPAQGDGPFSTKEMWKKNIGSTIFCAKRTEPRTHSYKCTLRAGEAEECNENNKVLFEELSKRQTLLESTESNSITISIHGITCTKTLGSEPRYTCSIAISL